MAGCHVIEKREKHGKPGSISKGGKKETLSSLKRANSYLEAGKWHHMLFYLHSCQANVTLPWHIFVCLHQALLNNSCAP